MRRWATTTFGGILFASVALLATTSAGTGAAFAYGTNSAVTLNISTSTVDQGGSFTLDLNGPANDTFTIVIHSDALTLGTMTTASSGFASATFTIPSDFPTGSHVITATDSLGRTGSVGLTVTAPTTVVTTSTAPLPFTGADVAAMSAVGAGAVGGGGLLLLASRKRRRVGSTSRA